MAKIAYWIQWSNWGNDLIGEQKTEEFPIWNEFGDWECDQESGKTWENTGQNCEW